MEMKEAIEILEELQKFLKKIKTIEEAKTIQKALDEALKALAYTEFMKDQHSCNDCGRAKECVIKPGWGHVVRINCVNWSGEQESQWISVSEGLPKIDKEGYSEKVLVCCKNTSIIEIAEYRVVNGMGDWYVGDLTDKFTDFGVPVLAWMPLPKPYKGE